MNYPTIIKSSQIPYNSVTFKDKKYLSLLKPMLNRILFKLALFVLFIVPAGLVSSCLANQPLINFIEFDAYVEKAMQDWLVPGAAIAIVKDGKIVHLKTYGVSNLKSKKPVTPQTIFPIASLTKGFTVAILSQLVEEGKIQWNDKVRKYLPDFRIADETASDTFTIEDLLSHRSGLPGYAGDSLVETGWSAQEIYQALHKIPLKTPFRSAYDYQNVFPGIAGWIAAKIAEKPLSELYEEYLFQPLQLEQTSIGKDGLTGGESLWIRFKKKIKSYFSDRTSQYCQQDDKAVEIIDGNDSLYCFEASRGIDASITDMAKWLIFQLGDGTHNGHPLISPTHIHQMRTSHINIGAPQGGRLFPKERVKNIAYGMGWFIHDYDRLEIIGHMGGMAGTRSIMAISPQEKIGIVILSNTGGMRVSLFPEVIRSKFFDLYLKLPDQHDWSQKLLTEIKASRSRILQNRANRRLQSPKAAHNLQTYTGVFENDLYGQLKVTMEQGKLYLNYRKLKVELTHWNGDSFSFLPNVFSKAYSGTDIGDVMFGAVSSKEKSKPAMGVNLLHEGADSVFYRQN